MQGLIDFHHHARPAAFFDALAESGRATMGGRPFPAAWTMANALDVMDRTGIATAVVSAPDADLLYRDRPVALRLSRLLNELFAKTIQSRPDRFGAFASLPMPHLDDALAEVAFALDELQLDGVMLSTSYDGRYLGSADFDAMLSELDQRQSHLFVHPVTPLRLKLLALDFPASLFIMHSTQRAALPTCCASACPRASRIYNSFFLMRAERCPIFLIGCR